MAKTVVFLLIFVLCQVICEGFDFTFDPRVPDSTTRVTGRLLCGILRCSEILANTSDDQSNRSRTLTKLKVYRTQRDRSTVSGDTWQELASISTAQPNLNRVSDGVKVTGQLTGQQASLFLEITKPKDCQESQFSCVAEIEDDLGRTSVKKSLVGKDVSVSSPATFIREEKVSVPLYRQHVDADSKASLSVALLQLVNSIQLRVESLESRVEDSLRALENRLEDKVGELKTVVTDKSGALDKSMEARLVTLDTKLNNFENRVEDKMTQLQNLMLQNLKSPSPKHADTYDAFVTQLNSLDNKMNINTEKLDLCIADVKAVNESTVKALAQVETAVGQCASNQSVDFSHFVSDMKKMSVSTQTLVSKVESFIGGYGAGALVSVEEFFDPLNTGKKEWRLAFRGTAHNNVEVYPAYLYGTGIPVEVEQGCKQFNNSLPCVNHYRNREALESWTKVDEVLLAIYKGGQMVKRVIFSGKGSTFTSWFAADRVIDSSWTDLTTKPHNYFSIAGAIHGGVDRRFFMNRDYNGGCPGFKGWFKVSDSNRECSLEINNPAIPLFQYAPGNTFAVWEANADKADAFGIFVKYE